jgi:hypothetical protein
VGEDFSESGKDYKNEQEQGNERNEFWELDYRLTLAGIFLVFQSVPNARAQEPPPPRQDLDKVFPKKPPYSRYADRHFPKWV